MAKDEKIQEFKEALSWWDSMLEKIRLCIKFEKENTETARQNLCRFITDLSPSEQKSN